MNKSKCIGCKYHCRRWPEKYVPGYGPVQVGYGYHACNYPPYWGKTVETIAECPKAKKIRR